MFAVFICAIAIDILLFGCLQQIFMYCDTLAKITIPPINFLYPILSPFLYWMNELINKWSSYDDKFPLVHLSTDILYPLL